MRILKLRFENINSLKGIHTVDFASAPLSDAGLFAITGPIGAGKTTLLDVITLALFNRTPRIGRISLSEITDNGVIVTRNTESAFAEVEYESKGKRYRSKWYIGKKRNGGFNDYEMELAEVEPSGLATILVSKKSSVPDENAKLIGLSYEQFERSIILSQGEFSKFLKSGRNDRSKLLEQLTGTQVFRALGIKAFEKKREADKLIDLKREALKGVEILSEADVQDLVDKLHESGRKLSVLLSKIERRSVILQVKKDLATLQQVISQEELVLASLLKQKEASLEDEKALLLHEKAIPLQPQLLEVNGLKREAEKLKKIILDLESAVRQSTTVQVKLYEEVGQTIRQDVDAENFHDKVLAFRKNVSDLKSLISLETEKRKHIESTLISIREDLKEDYPRQVLKEADKPAYLDKLISSKRAELQSLTVPSDLTEENAESLVRSITEKIRLFESLKRESLRYHELFQKTSKGQASLLELQTSIETFSKKLADENGVVEIYKAEKDVLIHQQLLQSKIASLDELRIALKEEDPCPLCGSLDHPYVREGHPIVSDFEELLKKKQDQIFKAEGSLKKLNADLGEKKGELTRLTAQIKEMSGEITVSEAAIKSINALLNVVHTDHTLLDQELEKINRELLDVSSWQTLSRQLMLLARLHDAYLEHQVKNKTIEKLQSDCLALYPSDDLEARSNSWINAHSSTVTRIHELSVQVKNENENLEKTSTLLKKTSALLLQAIMSAGFKDENELSEAILSSEKVKMIREASEMLTKEISKKTGALDSYRLKLKELGRKDLSKVETAVLEKILHDHRETSKKISEEKGRIQAQLESNSRNELKFKTISSELSTLEKDAWKWNMLDELIGDSKGNTFCNIVQDLTIRHLFAHANARLEKLTDRYLLVAGDAEKEDIEVIDRYMGNVKRIAKSLSGGETFLVSLALALGLSDLASRNVRLDSLFIDEGFGTLDPETLEVAISTLEKLQAESNKTIGIISHVEALKDRISCQIRVNRTRSGYSELVIG